MSEVIRPGSSELQSAKRFVVIWLVVSIVASTLIVAAGVANLIFGEGSATIGFWSATWRLALGFILSVPASLFLASIGDKLRTMAMPVVILSSGFVDTLKTKLFWAIGPQIIGVLIGQAIVWSLILAR